MPDTDILGFWVIYLLMAALIIGSAAIWIGSYRDNFGLELEIAKQDNALLIKTLRNIDDKVVVSLDFDPRYNMVFRDGNLVLSFEKIRKAQEIKDVEGVFVRRRDSRIIVVKNE